MDTTINSTMISGETEDPEMDDMEKAEAWKIIVEIVRQVGMFAIFIASIFLVTILMCMRTRKHLCLRCCWGHYALLVPVNFLESRTRRRVFCAAFALITMEILEQIHGPGYFEPQNVDGYVKFFIRLVIMTINGIAFLPLVSAIYMGTTGSCCLGIFYMGLFFAYNILLIIFRFGLELEDLLDKLVVRIILITVCGLYIVYWFIKRIVKNITQGPKNEKRISKYHTRYVKKLLSKRCSFTLILDTGKASRMKQWFRDKLYRKIPGFKYSLTILITSTCSFVILTKLANWVFSFVVIYYRRFEQLLDSIDSLKTSNMPNIYRSIVKLIFKVKGEAETTDDPSDTHTLITWYEFLDSQLTIVLVAFTAGILLAYLGNSIGLVHMLVTYRNNVMNLYRHNTQQNILFMNNPQPVRLVTSATQFAGYQVAHMMWGFFIQLGFYGLVVFLLGELIFIPLKFDFWFVFWRLFKFVMPIVFVLLVTKIVLYLLVRFVFLEDRGKTMALDNRRGYFVMMYMMFFYTIFTGIFSCLLRIVKCAVLGIIFVSRLDRSVFPRAWEPMDSGFRAYTSLLRLEALQCNPVLHTFVDILLRKKPGSKLDDMMWKYGVEEEIVLNGPKTPKPQLLARNRWFVAVTLIRNPSLIKTRRGIHNKNLIPLAKPDFETVL